MVGHASAQDLQTVWSPPTHTFESGIGSENGSFYDMEQDKRGFIYLASSWGIVEFDGETWKLLPMPPPENRTIHAVAKDENGTIYFGGQNEFGTIHIDENGVASHKSLMHLVGHDLPKNNVFFEVEARPEGVYFQSDSMIVRLSGNDVKTWESGPGFARMFRGHGELLFVFKDGPIYHLVNDEMAEIPEFYNLTSFINVMFPISDGRYLVGTYSGQLYHWTPGAQPVELFTDASDYLHSNLLEGGKQLADGSLLIKTWRNGVLWLDENGKRIGTIDSEHFDVPNKIPQGFLEDREGDIWTSFGTTLVRMDPDSPVHHIPVRISDESSIQSLTFHNGDIYVGTNTGLFKNLAGSTGRREFTPVYNELNNVEDLHSQSGTLFIRARNQWYEELNDSVQFTGIEGGSLATYPFDSDVIVSGSTSGLRLAKWNAAERKLVGQTELVPNYPFSHFEIDFTGRVWALTEPPGLVMAETNPEYAGQFSLWQEVDDYPVHLSDLALFKGEIVFSTSEGLSTFDPDARLFTPFSPGLNEPESNGKSLGSALDGSLLIFLPHGIEMLKERDESWQLITDTRNVSILTSDQQPSSSALWGFKEDALIRIDLDGLHTSSESWNVQLKSVLVDDSLQTQNWVRDQLTTLTGGASSFAFEFTIPRYTTDGGNEYSFRLPGIQDEWTGWSTDNTAQFPRLAPGKYTLQIRGSDGFGSRSVSSSFPFQVRPRWYASLWAYVLWLLLIAGGSMLGTTMLQARRVRHLEQRARELEIKVEKRTAEVVDQKNQLESQAEMLKELDKAKSRFFTNLSHEFRTPLTLLTGPIHRLLDGKYGPVSAEATHAFERADINADRLNRLINQLLDLSRLESGSLSVKSSEYNLSDFVRKVTGLFESISVESGLTLNLTLPDQDVFAHYDPDHMEKVLVNLLSNALKFTPSGGSIGVTVSVRENWACLSVQDTGIGIEPALHERVFERFYQVDDSSTREQEGMGIGLAMSREFMRAMGGNIQVQSAPGSGSIFDVLVPLAHLSTPIPTETVQDQDQEMDESSHDASPVPPAYTEDSSTLIEGEDAPVVLVVEDNADLSEFLKELLQEQFQVLQAVDGLEGWEMASQFIPDLIVSDVMMPRMDGIELCQDLKSDIRTSHIPVVLLTARTQIEHRLEGFTAGADAYLEKPFNAQELEVRIMSLLEQRRRLRDVFSNSLGGNDSDFDGIEALSPVDREFQEKLESIIETLFFQTDFGVDQFADAMHMSRRHLQRKLVALTDETPVRFIQKVRLQKAAEKLRSGQASVKAVAHEVGYLSRSHFSKQFALQFGESPAEYAKSSFEG